MGRPLDVDLRRRAVSAVENGLSTGQAARRFSVSKAAVGAWVRLKRATGDVLPKPQGKGFGSVLDPHEAFILELIEAQHPTPSHRPRRPRTKPEASAQPTSAGAVPRQPEPLGASPTSNDDVNSDVVNDVNLPVQTLSNKAVQIGRLRLDAS